MSFVAALLLFTCSVEMLGANLVHGQDPRLFPVPVVRCQHGYGLLAALPLELEAACQRSQHLKAPGNAAWRHDVLHDTAEWSHRQVSFTRMTGGADKVVHMLDKMLAVVKARPELDIR